MSFDILVTAPSFERAGLDLLEQAGCRVDCTPLENGREEVARRLAAKRYDGVISRFVPIPGAVMATCPSLRVISRAAAGYDIIDIPAATAQGIAVVVAVGANAQSVAEYTMGLIFACARDIPRHARATEQGGWERSRLGIELHGRTLGLVGYGRIARGVARMALAVGMRVLAWTPRLAAGGDIAPVECAASLADLLRRADVVSLHAPLNAASRGMIGAAELALMPPAAMLVNTARGGQVDEAALIAALREGRLRAAALDVRPTEPPPPALLLGEVPNLIQTPHMGGGTTIARAATARVAATHLLDVLLGRRLPPDACMNPEVLAR